MKCFIDAYFQEREYNITDLCKFVGITRSAYYRIIKSEVCPKVDTCLKIVKYLNENCCQNESYKFTIEDLWQE